MTETTRWCPACKRFTTYVPDPPDDWRCTVCGRLFDDRDETRGLGHYLWTNAAKAAELVPSVARYVKREWAYFFKKVGLDDDV